MRACSELEDPNCFEADDNTQLANDQWFIIQGTEIHRYRT